MLRSVHTLNLAEGTLSDILNNLVLAKFRGREGLFIVRHRRHGGEVRVVLGAKRMQRENRRWPCVGDDETRGTLRPVRFSLISTINNIAVVNNSGSFLNNSPQQLRQIYQWPALRYGTTFSFVLSYELLTISLPANCPQVNRRFVWPLSGMQISRFSIFAIFLSIGKAPRKQLATKAARKTAQAVRTISCDFCG